MLNCHLKRKVFFFEGIIMEIVDCQKYQVDSFVGKRIREKRLKMGLTLSDVGDKLGISHQQVQKYELAESKISVFILFQFGKIFSVDASYFFKGCELFFQRQNKLEGNFIKIRREKPLNIILVEDDPAEELILRRALNDIDSTLNIIVLRDGGTLIDFLRNKKTNIDFPRPDIIIMDLNVPNQDGVSLLKEIKRDREVCDIPVVILTNSINFDDMISCYRSNASGFMCKGYEYDEFKSHLKTCIKYWSDVVILPSQSKSFLNIS